MIPWKEISALTSMPAGKWLRLKRYKWVHFHCTHFEVSVLAQASLILSLTLWQFLTNGSILFTCALLCTKDLDASLSRSFNLDDILVSWLGSFKLTLIFQVFPFSLILNPPPSISSQSSPKPLPIACMLRIEQRWAAVIHFVTLAYSASPLRNGGVFRSSVYFCAVIIWWIVQQRKKSWVCI